MEGGIDVTHSIDEIATMLYKLGFPNDNEPKDSTLSELNDALYDIKSTAQNKYNASYWKTLWNCLESAADYD